MIRYYNNVIVNSFLIVALFVVPITSRFRLGDPCTVEGKLGTCKYIYNCPYADKLVKIETKKPTHCAWEGIIEIVCCPNNDISHMIGVGRGAFSDAVDGIISSDDKTCRYNGEMPIKCCSNPTYRLAPIEAASCPPLRSQTTKRNDLPWRKCLEYQRYQYPCVPSKQNPGLYVRSKYCGIHTFGIRVSDGDPAFEKEFPHMALLGYKNGIKTEWGAGGSLISEMYILTAAHVISHTQYGTVRYALLGTTTKLPKNGSVYNVQETISHTFYKSREKYNDIALLKLDRRVRLSQWIKPACLPMADMVLGQGRIICGWGQTGPYDKLSDKLLKANINIVNDRFCEENADRKMLPRGWDRETMMCAGDVNLSKKDTCRGDSGGPVMAVLENLSCTYMVEAVVSWGPTCGKGAPATYTKVAPYMDWILANVWPNEK